MWQYILKRTLHAFLIMFLVATTVFFAVRFLPGSPVTAQLGIEATSPEAIAALKTEMGLDKPLSVQYVDWMLALLQFDLGSSLQSGAEVSTLILQAARKTFSIAILGVTFGLSIALPTGIISATRRREPVDAVASVGAFLGLSMPPFFIGILLAMIFGVELGLLPVVGYASFSEGIWPWFTHLLLPAIAVGLPYGAILMRILRSGLIEVLNQPYMRTAQAKGVNRRNQLYKHALQNAFISVITVAGIQLAVILFGSVTVEIVFSIKGLGRLLVDSIFSRDYTVVQGVVLLLAAVMVYINLLVDLSYTVLNPQIRYGGEE